MKSILLQFNIIVEKFISSSIIVLILLAIYAIIFGFAFLMLNIIFPKTNEKFDKYKSIVIYIVISGIFIAQLFIFSSLIIDFPMQG